MDWNFLEKEIIDKISWEIENNKLFNETVNKICHQYSIEFPKFSVKINELKEMIINIPETLEKKRKIN